MRSIAVFPLRFRARRHSLDLLSGFAAVETRSRAMRDQKLYDCVTDAMTGMVITGTPE
jgi:hypothetical protein